jgi:hypothetical protein
LWAPPALVEISGKASKLITAVLVKQVNCWRRLPSSTSQVLNLLGLLVQQYKYCESVYWTRMREAPALVEISGKASKLSTTVLVKEVNRVQQYDIRVLDEAPALVQISGKASKLSTTVLVKPVNCGQARGACARPNL